MMEREEESDKMTVFHCVFVKQDCPVKAFYKLRPESLALFCAPCPLIKEDKAKLDFEKMVPMISSAINMLSQNFDAMNKERAAIMATYADIIERLLPKRDTEKDFQEKLSNIT